MSKLVQFLELMISDIFHLLNDPERRKFIKSDRSHYISQGGRRTIDPKTTVEKVDPPKGGRTFLNNKKDE